jgi:hypothetical protein
MSQAGARGGLDEDRPVKVRDVISKSEILKRKDRVMTQEKAFKTVENLIAAGWEFKAHSFTPTKGWWILPGDDQIKAMRRGDPKLFHQGAIETAKLYAPECLA